MIDWSKPLRWVSNCIPVRVICTDRKHTLMPIIILRDAGTLEETIYVTHDGRLYPGTSVVVENVPEVKRSYQSVYKTYCGGGYSLPPPQQSREDPYVGYLERVFEGSKLVDIIFHKD